MTAVYWGGSSRSRSSSRPEAGGRQAARAAVPRDPGRGRAGLNGKPAGGDARRLTDGGRVRPGPKHGASARARSPRRSSASLVTIVREGVEVILVLAMLIALATRTGQSEVRAAHTGALRAIAWGVALAIVASLGTAVGLNLLVASTQGRTRELLEGVVMLLAAGVLFYVSYWLISQSESRRWLDFLKRQAAGWSWAAVGRSP